MTGVVERRDPELVLTEVTVELSGTPIVTDVDLVVLPGEKVGLVGPNGSGKTTLLRAAYRSLRPVAGMIALAGSDLASLSQRQIARRSSLVAQESGSDFEFTVEDVVELGRAPHQRVLDRTAQIDRAAVAEALARTGMSAYAHRSYATLSGGEKQRVLVARALAQDAPLLLLDEPTNHLDISAALDLLELVQTLDRSVLCVLHDLNLAAAYCDRLFVMHSGRVVAEGPPAEVLTTALVSSVFGVDAHLLTNPASGRPLLAFSAIGNAAAREEAG